MEESYAARLAERYLGWFVHEKTFCIQNLEGDLLEEVVEAFRYRGCTVERLKGTMIRVTRPEATRA